MRPACVAPAAGLCLAARGHVAARRGRVAVRLSPPLASRLLLPTRRRAALPAARLRASASGSCSSDEDQEEERSRSDSGSAAGGSGSAPASNSAPLAAVSLITRIWGDRPQNDGPINYAQFMEYLQNKRVLRLLIYDGGKNAIVEVCIPGYEDEPYEKMEKQRFSVALPGDYQEEVLRLAKQADRRSAAPQSGNVACKLYFVDPAAQAPALVGQAASWLLPILVFWIFLRGLDFAARMRGKRRNQRAEVAAQFGRSRATRSIGMGRGNTGVMFSDVAGQDAAIEAFQEIIDQMQGDPRFSIAGAKMPKGVLLEGPPGTGKTLLAKAVAGEAGVPFFSANGSEFVEMFVGVAAARVRDLFKRARANAPSIVFIDEIDTIGRARTGSGAPDAKEREQGLLQLLVEMDGFDTKKSGVLLIGATNRKEVLDAALLRSGRFDRVLRMGLPTMAERFDVLTVHAAGKTLPRGADSVSEEFPEGDALLRTAAMVTEGYSGADLANLLNEAAILSVRRNKPSVELAEIETAMEKLKVGLPRAPLGDSAYKRQLAWVYAGRAVLQTAAAALQPDVLQVSIAPRGSTVARLDSMPAKRSWGRPGSEAALQWSELVDRLAVRVAGRAVEEVVFGEAAASMLTAPDVAAATSLAAEMVGTSGLYVRRDSPVPFHLVTLGEDEVAKWPGPVAEALDAGVQDTMDEAFARARAAVRQLRPAIDVLAAELLAQETVYGARIRAIVRDTPCAAQPLAPLAAEARDFMEPFSMGGCIFDDTAGRSGVISFSPQSKEAWEYARQVRLERTTAPTMGLASFGMTGESRIGVAVFHGWVERPPDPDALRRVAAENAAAEAAAAAAAEAAARAKAEAEAEAARVKAEADAAARAQAEADAAAARAKAEADAAAAAAAAKAKAEAAARARAEAEAAARAKAEAEAAAAKAQEEAEAAKAKEEAEAAARAKAEAEAAAAKAQEEAARAQAEADAAARAQAEADAAARAKAEADAAAAKEEADAAARAKEEAEACVKAEAAASAKAAADAATAARAQAEATARAAAAAAMEAAAEAQRAAAASAAAAAAPPPPPPPAGGDGDKKDFSW